MTDTTKEAREWTPSCGGNFAQATACGKCTTCLNNLKRIAESTPLGKQYGDLKAKHERVLQMLELAVAQLQYTQNLFKAEDLDNSVVLSMIAHEIAQIESLK